MPKKPKLTVKQAKFVKAKAEGKTGVQAAMEAYDTTDYRVANTIAVENMQKPSIQQAVQVSMERQGLTVDKVVKPIVDGMTAEHEYYDKNGEMHTRPDHSTRLKASGMALDLMGAKSRGESGNTIIFNKGDIVKDKYVKD